MLQFFKEWCLATSCHGWADLIQSKLIITRILWILALCFSFFMIITTITGQINEYIKGDHWISSSNFQKNADGLELPYVAICNMNRASKQKLVQMNMSAEVASYILNSQELPLLDGEKAAQNERQNFSYLEQEFQSYTDRFSHRISMETWLSNISIDCEQTLFMCSRMNSGFDCCANSKYIYVETMGRCISLQLPQHQRIQKDNGQWFGMQFYLQNNISDYPSLIQTSYFEKGHLLFFGFDSVSRMQRTPTPVSPGQSMQVSFLMKRRVLTTTNTFPYVQIFPVPCDIEKQLKLIDAHYSIENCRLDCWAQYLLEHCGCTLIAEYRIYVNICAPVEWQNCLQQTRTLDPERVAYRSCQRSCRPACFDKQVVEQVTTTDFPAPSQVKPIVERARRFSDGAQEDAVKQMSSVSIYYNSMTEEVVELRERLTFSDFISNIGGQLGIWAGISFVTIFQAGVFLIDAIMVAITGLVKLNAENSTNDHETKEKHKWAGRNAQIQISAYDSGTFERRLRRSGFRYPNIAFNGDAAD